MAASVRGRRHTGRPSIGVKKGCGMGNGGAGSGGVLCETRPN